MTITQLKYVLAVAEHKNFTLAAEKCFVTQPTLSMQIQKIEEELKPENAWHTTLNYNPDAQSSLKKNLKVKMMKLIPKGIL